MKATTVRYYAYYRNDDGELDELEVDAHQFEVVLNDALTGDPMRVLDDAQLITYERHTVRENGVSQICLTLDILVEV